MNSEPVGQDNNCPKFHFEQIFEWNIKFMGEFFLFTYDDFKRIYEPRIKSDYHDIFSDSFIKFHRAMEQGKYHFVVNQEAYKMLHRIFVNTFRDFRRKKSTRDKKMLGYQQVLSEPTGNKREAQVDLKVVQSICDKTDKMININPKFLTPQLLEFYFAYKTAIFSYNDEDDVRKYITDIMHISDENYATLKSRFFMKLKSFLDKSDFS